jgi:hypothetical protein
MPVFSTALCFLIRCCSFIWADANAASRLGRS